MAQVILKPRKARPFYGRHPWVLDSAVDRIEGAPADAAIFRGLLICPTLGCPPILLGLPAATPL